MSGHPPLGAQVMLNGHEFVACQAQKAGIGFTKQATALLQSPMPPGWRRSHTTCLCFALDPEEQKRSIFSYSYSVFQMEYSRNFLFQSDSRMEQIFQALIDRSRSPLDLDRVKTIFGDKKRPHHSTRKKNPTRWGVVVETPDYDVTVFKVHYGK